VASEDPITCIMVNTDQWIPSHIGHFTFGSRAIQDQKKPLRWPSPKNWETLTLWHYERWLRANTKALLRIKFPIAHVQYMAL
jgi:hypothetical protein